MPLTKLIIEDEEALNIASELAERQHVTPEQVVVGMLRANRTSFATQKGRIRDPDTFVARWSERTRPYQRPAGEPDVSQQVAELLYDENGLPN